MVYKYFTVGMCNGIQQVHDLSVTKENMLFNSAMKKNQFIQINSFCSSKTTKKRF